MGFIANIISFLNTISSLFYRIYNAIWNLGAGWHLAAELFYQGCLLFNSLAWAFYDFGTWINEVTAKLSQILTWDNIVSFFRDTFDKVASIWSWFWDKLSWFATEFSRLWINTWAWLQPWIDQRIRDLAAIPAWFTQAFNSLKAAWDSFVGKIPAIDVIIAWWGNWWGNIMAQLGSWWNNRLLEVQGLINSALINIQSWSAGWQDVRESVVEFINDPIEFIWQRFADWFLGPE